jgi:hypothetical protein
LCGNLINKLTGEEDKIGNRLRLIVHLEDDMLLLETYNTFLNDIKHRSKYDSVSLCQVFSATRLRIDIIDKDVRKHFDKLCPPFLHWTHMLAPCPVWKLRLELKRSISDITVDNDLRRELLEDDRWQSLREFMFMSTKAAVTAPLIEFLQIKVERHIIIAIASFIYF